MANDPDAFGVKQLRRLFEGGVTSNLTDSELVNRFLARDGQAAECAFATLVDRHGPMVLRIARSLLRESHDADDAFQVTFLVLARKSGSLRVTDSLGPWLHGVTCRVAARIRSADARHRARERRAAKGTTMSITDRTDDLGSIVHDEINRLPARFRVPIVLCLLEGLTQEQAAHVLGWPSGTVRSRLARGRVLLRSRLARRGLGLSTMLGVSLAPESAVAAPLAERAVQASLACLSHPASAWGVSLSVVKLTSEVSRSLAMSQFKSTAALLCLTLCVGLAGFRAIAQPNGDVPAATLQTGPAKAASGAPRVGTANLESRRQARGDLAMLQGAWDRVSMEVRGRQASRGGAGWTATYEDDQLTLRSNGEQYRRSLIVLDPSTSPKSINTWDRDGPAKDQTFPGIYEIDGDTMRVCIAEPGKPRPTEFTTVGGSGFLYYTYKRRQP